MPTTLGLVSDTHGLVRPEALEALSGVDAIVHAGDIGSPDVIALLSAVAPVHAVRGNVDRGAWAQAFPATEVVEIEDVLLYLLHDLDALDLDPAAAGFAAVISGHSHTPRVEQRGDVWFVNPGSIGPRRFTLPIALARMTIDGTSIAVEPIALG